MRSVSLCVFEQAKRALLRKDAKRPALPSSIPEAKRGRFAYKLNRREVGCIFEGFHAIARAATRRRYCY